MNAKRPPGEAAVATTVALEANASAGSDRGRVRSRLATIGGHLTTLVVIQVVLVLVMITIAGIDDFRAARKDATTNAATTAKLAADFLADDFESTQSSLTELGPQIVGALDFAEVCKVSNPGPQPGDKWVYTSLHAVRFDGTSICDEPRPHNVSGETWFEQAMRTEEPVVAEPSVDSLTGKHSIMVALKVPSLKVVAALSYEFASVGPALDATFGIGDEPPTFVVTTKDRTSEIGSSGGGNARSLEGSAFAVRHKNGDIYPDMDGVERVYSSATVPSLGWEVFAGISTEDAFAGARHALRGRVLIACIMVLLVIAAAWVLHRRFVRPVRALGKATERIKTGDLDATVTPGGPVELNALGESFNEMLDVRRKAEEALLKAFVAEQHASEELREIDGMRKAFLMAISHELRTPLTSVVGYADFLDTALDDMSDAEVKQSVGAIAKQSKRLQRILLDLLDVERLSRGTIEPNIKEADIRRLVADVIERSSANGRIKVQVSGSTTGFVDPALTERMVENLVVNAIKHTPPDTRIWVKASRANDRLRISVEDAGPGVPDELKTSIFDPFKQGVVPEHSPGTGVGLSLVAQFAKLQGGRAWVEDRRGGGASFKIELPADNPEMRHASRRRRALASERAA